MKVAAAALAAALALALPHAQAGSPRLCEKGVELSTPQKDRRLRLVAQVRQLLQQSGAGVALIARSGVDLARLGQRYSHAGISLRDSPHTPWSVRQLYYACDEGRPRLYDQGLAGFLLAADDAPTAHVSLLLLPDDAAAALQAAAQDTPLALQLLAATYSANAYPFSTRYQNCNQWVAELLAAAWGPARPSRAQAQQWLQDQGYVAHRFDVGWLMPLSWLVPLLRHDDHPEQDLREGSFHVSMPVSLEAFVRQQLPATQRVELCHDDRHIVLRRGWRPMGPGCEPDAGDVVMPFDGDAAPV